ncbi:ubiquitin-specific protease ubp15 [Coemansia sp. RSA 720]|nr:ubiquitin-specific protease ubp15 [Coemansia sp. RSA 720]
MTSRTGTPMEQAPNGTSKPAVSSAEPVYRFYLSPPPSGTPGYGTPGLGTQSPDQSQAYPPLGMHAFNPYMMSPAQGIASVSAFGHPAYYAPAPQSMYYPSAYGMAAMPGVQARASNVSSGSVQTKEEEARTPIVNEAGVPVGGYGADQEGQYIEIKFPTFGQAQMQQMFQQMHIQPLVSAAASEAEASPGTQNISIYDAENFADAHMEDIVFDRKAFFWKISNWDKLERRATSDVFKCGGFAWRILLRPFGSSHKGVLSLFLECMGDASEDWRGMCRFVLAIANPHDASHNTHGAAYHCFHRSNPNWGFTRFMKLADLRTAAAPGVRPFIEDGACTIAAYLHVIKDPSQ